jgi:hypothetical protein
MDRPLGGASGSSTRSEQRLLLPLVFLFYENFEFNNKQKNGTDRACVCQHMPRIQRRNDSGRPDDHNGRPERAVCPLMQKMWRIFRPVFDTLTVKQ